MRYSEAMYKDASTLTRWVRYLLFAQILVAIVSIYSNVLEYQLLSDYQNGVYTSQDQAAADGAASDSRQQAVGIAYLLIFLLSGFLILRWIHRANFNARNLGAQGMQFTPGWSIGYYFIPILTLWKPYLAMKEIWQASHNPGNWAAEKVSAVLGLWWFLWIVSNMLGQAVFRMSRSADEIPELMNVNIVSQVSDVLDIPLALVTLAVVDAIYRAQSRAYEGALRAMPASGHTGA